jgi:hypothetical protein
MAGSPNLNQIKSLPCDQQSTAHFKSEISGTSKHNAILSTEKHHHKPKSPTKKNKLCHIEEIDNTSSIVQPIV